MDQMEGCGEWPDDHAVIARGYSWPGGILFILAQACLCCPGDSFGKMANTFFFHGRDTSYDELYDLRCGLYGAVIEKASNPGIKEQDLSSRLPALQSLII